MSPTPAVPPAPPSAGAPVRTAAPGPPADAVAWRVVVPLKALRSAKSRLGGLGDPVRREVALAMASDTVAACVEAVGPDAVWVVTADATVADRAGLLGAVVTPDPGAGLNAAVLVGAERARAAAPCPVAVAAVVGDLPCLTAADLRVVLDAAAAHDRAFVPDADGSGTVLVTAAPGVGLAPRFGVGSAARHAEVAARLDAPASLRLDVDDVRAWQRARAARPGPYTSALADSVDGA